MEVREAIKQIENDYDVEVIKARDYGSRAWNLDDPESDRDVALVFRQPVHEYIGIKTYRETISRDFDGGEDGGIEIVGWNIKYYFEMLQDANPVTMEFLASDLEYYHNNDYRQQDWTRIAAYAMNNFNPNSLYHHYRQMAKNQYERYVAEKDKPTVKKNLYVIRALMYAQWVIQTHQFPELNFDDFLMYASTREFIDRDALEFAVELKDRKKQGEGSEVIGNPLQDYIEERIDKVPEPEPHNVQDIEAEELNKYLRDIFE